jgi:hypothetical protein
MPASVVSGFAKVDGTMLSQIRRRLKETLGTDPHWKIDRDPNWPGVHFPGCLQQGNSQVLARKNHAEAAATRSLRARELLNSRFASV